MVFLDRLTRVASLYFAIQLGGCATYWQVSSLEEKVDRLVQATNRETMSQIFGDQAGAITQKMDTMNEEQKTKLDTIITSYEKGSTSLEEVRASVLNTLGGTDRVVANPRGIWVRDEEGKRAKAIGMNAKLQNCQVVNEDALPATIASNKALAQYRWGKAELNGKTVLFPWELTMSTLTKEIVENAAKRTAQEILKMAGDKGWNRPVHITVVTEANQNLRINTPGAESEVFVTAEGAQEPAPQPQPQQQPQPQPQPQPQ